MIAFYHLKMQFVILLRWACRPDQLLRISSRTYKDRVPDCMRVKFERISLALRSTVAWQDEFGVEGCVIVTIEFELLQMRC